MLAEVLAGGTAVQCLGSSQSVCSCPCPTQLLHSLPTCVLGLALPRQARHSKEGLRILEMPPGEARAGKSCLVPGESLGEKRVSLRPASGSWKTEGSACAPRNDNILGEGQGHSGPARQHTIPQFSPTLATCLAQA